MSKKILIPKEDIIKAFNEFGIRLDVISRKFKIFEYQFVNDENFYIKISSLMQKVDALNMGSDLNGTYQKLKSVIDKSCTLIRECKNTEPKDYDRLKDLYVRSLRLTRDLESAVEELSCLYKSLGLKSKDDDFGETDIYLAEILDTSETRD
jgi:hypothetical protein